MRVRVQQDRCQGHTLCALTAPEIFQLSAEDGHAYVLTELVAADLEDKARQAASTCPEQAISVEP